MEIDYKSLSERFLKIKSELHETDISIEKLKRYENVFPSQGNRQVQKERIASSEEISDVKMEENDLSSESEESGSDNNHSKKVALQSAVIKRIGSSKTRRNFIHTYNADNKVQLRNRRFLGMVQNTLQKFRDEEVRRQPQNLKRKKALEKVEAAAEEEKNSVRRQKAELFEKSKKQRKELEHLQSMMEITESFELWENNQKNLLGFVATKTKPEIFFLPKLHSSATKKQLERTRMKITAKIEKQKEVVKEVLSSMSQKCDLSMHVSVNTEDSSLMSEIVSSQCALKPEIAAEEAKYSTEESSQTSEIISSQGVSKPEFVDEEEKDEYDVLQLNLNECEAENLY